MNYYTWHQQKLAPLLNFDWGSQSIAQSKFQRASRLGKEDQQKVSFLIRQYFSRRIFKNFEKGSGPLLTFRLLHFTLPASYGRVGDAKGRGTCKPEIVLQVLFVEIECISSNSLFMNC